MNTLLPLVASFLVTIQLMCSAGAVYKVIANGAPCRFPLDIRLGWIGCAITLAVAFIALRKGISPKWLFVATIVLTVAVALAVLAADLFGIIVR